MPLLTLVACGGGTGRARLATAAVVLEDARCRAAVASALDRRGVEVIELQAPRAVAGVQPAARARRRIALAREAQQAFREAEALEELAGAEAILTEDGVLADHRPLLAEAAFLRAWIHLSGGRPTQAERAVLDALSFADAADPDPARFPPEVVQLAARLRQPSSTATLRVESSTVEATVSIDGRSVGLTPVEAGGLAVGSHFVTVEAAGYRRISDRIALGPVASVVRRYTPEPSGPADLLRSIATASPDSRHAVARRLAATADVDGVLVGTASMAGPGAAHEIRAELVPRDGTVVRARATGATVDVAADRLVARLLGSRGRGRSFLAEPLFWIVTGTLAVGVGAVALVLLLRPDGGGQSSDPAGSITCCDVR